MGQRAQASTPINLDTLRLIRESFADSGMTQLEVSRACGVPRSTLANILSHTADPRLIHVDQLVRIAMALGIDPREWIGELEALERKRRGESSDDLGARRRTRGRPAPQVQTRAARTGGKGKSSKG